MGSGKWKIMDFFRFLYTLAHLHTHTHKHKKSTERERENEWDFVSGKNEIKKWLVCCMLFSFYRNIINVLLHCNAFRIEWNAIATAQRLCDAFCLLCCNLFHSFRLNCRYVLCQYYYIFLNELIEWNCCANSIWKGSKSGFCIECYQNKCYNISNTHTHNTSIAFI